MRSAFARGWRQLRGDLRRYLVAASALTAAVALLLGTLSASRGIDAGLRAGVASLSGVAEAGVVPMVDGDTIAEADAAAVAELPGVRAVIPALSRTTGMRGTAQPADGGAGGGGTGGGGTGGGGTADGDLDLMLTGYPTRLHDLVLAVPSKGRLPRAGQAEVLVPDDVAERLGVGVSDAIVVAGVSGPQRLAVVGIVEARELGVFASDNVFADLDVVQRVFGEPDRLTRIDLLLDDDRTAAEWALATQGELPPDTRIQDTSAPASALQTLLATVTAVLLTATAITLVVAVLLAALAFGRTVSARRESYAVMRTVGARSTWLAGTVVAEVVLLGLLSSLAGSALGLAVGTGIVALLSSAGGLPAASASPAWWHIGAAIAVGVLAALAAGLRAVAAVAATPPVQVLAGDGVLPAGLPWRWTAAGGVATVAGAVLLVAGRRGGELPATVLFLLAAACLAPAALRVLARAAAGLRWPAALAGRRAGRGQSLGATTAMLTAVVALSTSLVLGVGAISRAMEDQITRQFGADVQVSSAVALDGTVVRRLTGVPGVATVSPLSTDTGTLTARGQTSEVSVRAIDPATYFDTASLPWDRGDDTTTPAALAGGDAVVLPAALSGSLGAAPGDTVQIGRGDLVVEATVAGTYASLITGSQVVVPRSLADRLGVSGADNWNVAAAPGADVGDLRDRVASELADIPGLSVVTAVDMRERAVAELGAYVGTVLGVVAITLGLGTLGAAGVMAMDVLRREREIGVLRAVGATRRGIAGLVLVEAALVGTSAVVVGLVLGHAAGAALTGFVGAALGANLAVVSRPGLLAVVVVVALGASVAAAVLPSRRASRINPIEALRHD